MNKIQFMFDHKHTEQNTSILPYKEFCRDFEFEFSAEFKAFENVVTEEDRSQIENMQDIFSGRRSSSISGHIVKSDIKENVLKQIKEMMGIIKKSGKELLCFKMNSSTKTKFRMYHNYEVDHIPKSTSFENVGNIVGCLLGVKIVQDEKIKDDVVLPLIKAEINSSTLRQKLNKILN